MYSCYSSATAYIVIVMVALAEELLALPTLLVTSLSAIEALLSETAKQAKINTIPRRIFHINMTILPQIAR